MSDSPRGGGPRGRRGNRPPPRRVEVRSISQITPRMVSVIFGGASLHDFPQPAPTAHVKVSIPRDGKPLPSPVVTADGEVTWPDGRPENRTYTPRRFDPQTGTLEVQFVLHGEGLASEWAASAAVGDEVGIGGPGGRFAVDPAVAHWWIGGDESAIPAIATLIEALPAAAEAAVHIEIESDADRMPMPEHAGVQLHWHVRRDGGQERWGAELDAALRAADLSEGTHVWLGCESTAVRRLRTHLLVDRSLSREQFTTRGYWRVGETNHPDHDYGED